MLELLLITFSLVLAGIANHSKDDKLSIFWCGVALGVAIIPALMVFDLVPTQ